MHAISIQDGFDYFQPALAPLDFAERQVKWWHKAAQINDATEAFDGFTWLRLNLYQARQSMAATVVHRYFHLDNVIANEDHINGVIHWGEMTLADPAIDVAWARMKIATELTPALGDRFAEAYARRVEQPLAAQPFWEVFAACKRLTELAQSRKSVRGGGETEEGTTMLPVDYEAKLARVTQFMRERLTDEE
jgi:aminoglycoside phosphotransferase (APT) family kinase protein